MRLLMYRTEGGPRLGALRGEDVIDLQALAQVHAQDIPGDILGLIDLGEDGLSRVRASLSRADEDAGNQSYVRSLSGVELLPPLDPPRENVLAIGRNYLEHAQESARLRGEEITRPTLFTKAQTSITGPYSDVPIDESLTSQVDWEAELGVVIGRRGKNIPRENAMDYVFGYTVVNDVSARDVQFGWGGQFYKGKSLDGFCPIGPWIVTRDEVPDPQNLRVTCRVNGETKQDSNTRNMIFPIDELIAQLSAGMTLLPGNLIATGTPEGIGAARVPPEFMKPGDVMETEVEGIGVLRNRFVSAG